jgi:hypothetical protein
VPETGKSFTADEARAIGQEIGIDWATSPFDVEQFRIGMNVELEHGLHDPRTNVSNDDPHVTAKIGNSFRWASARTTTHAWSRWEERRNDTGGRVR